MSSSSSLGDVFSFDTPDAVLQVLAAIRASDATSEKKNELRDLVLSFTNGGKDPSVQIQLTQQLQSLGINPGSSPQVSAVASTTAVDHDFGSARNAPVFPAPAPSPTPPAMPAPAPQPAPAASAPAAPQPAVEVPAQPASPAPQPTPVAPVQPAAPSTPQPVPATQTAPVAAQPVSVPQPAQTVSPVAPASTTPTPTTPPVSPQPAPAPQPVAAGNALNRIREIKSLVNEKVGNPVNLVDIDNAVGREYMAALLDAMKQVSAGGEATSAMARLETAYTLVEKVIKNQNTQPAQPTAAPTVSPSEPAPKPAPVSPAAVAPSETPVPVRGDNPDVATVQNQADARWDVASNRFNTTAQPDPTPMPAAPSASATPTAPQPAPKPVDTPEVPKANESAAPVSVHPKAEAAPMPTPTSNATGATVRPLTSTGTPLKTINDLPTADSLKTSETGDPLFTKEVTNGLNQLLSDWSLFKKSGLFGTGPKGIEHPLYAKIKDLQIPLLLAGRFEGATQEIKQSVTDYMNGWRYEQGIIYEQGETFDHYLRRVIKHILDLQK